MVELLRICTLILLTGIKREKWGKQHFKPHSCDVSMPGHCAVGFIKFVGMFNSVVGFYLQKSERSSHVHQRSRGEGTEMRVCSRNAVVHNSR